MKKIAIVAALAMSGLIYKTADAQIGVSLGWHFGSHRNDAPVARIAVQAPIYEENTVAGYYADNDGRYNRDHDAYRGRDERYDNRVGRGERMDERYDERNDRGRGIPDRSWYNDNQRYEQNNMQNNRGQRSNYADRNNGGGQQYQQNNMPAGRQQNTSPANNRGGAGSQQHATSGYTARTGSRFGS